MLRSYVNIVNLLTYLKRLLLIATSGRDEVIDF